MILEGARVVTCTDATASWLRVRDGVIVELGDGTAPADDDARVDLGGGWIGPGFIDTHIHGGFGLDVMDGRAEDVRTLARGLVRHGVTSFVPTTYTASVPQTITALEAIERARHSDDRDAAEILGVNMEGPFLDVRRKGAHAADKLLEPDTDLTDAFFAAARVVIMTVAPELPRAAALLDHLRRRGTVISLGHSDATPEHVRAAVGTGARCVTHLFNGMRPLHHRDVGLTGTALLTPELVCELIADGVHVDVDALRIAWRMKGPRGLVLVSDGGPHAGDGRHAADAVRLADGTLASSACMVDAGVRTLLSTGEMTLPELWRSASTNAADLLGLERKGRIAVGADADLVVLDDRANVRSTYVRGRRVHSA